MFQHIWYRSAFANDNIKSVAGSKSEAPIGNNIQVAYTDPHLHAIART